MAVGSTIKAAAIVSSLVTFVVAVGLNAYFNIPGVSPFNATIGNISHKYDTGITPSDATFGIWGVIYSWLLVLTVYCQTLLCRKSSGMPLYIEPGFIPTIFFVSFIITMLGNPGWIVVYLEEQIVRGAILLLLGFITAIVCLGSSCQRLDQCGAEMTKKDLIADIWCTRIIVQNGCALYGAWVSCATILNGIAALHYGYGVSMATCCYGGLVVLNVFLVGWFILETFMFDRQLRYVFAHYISYLAALSGSYIRNYDPNISYTRYLLALLIIAAILTAIKLVVMIVRGIKNPIHYKPANKW